MATHRKSRYSLLAVLVAVVTLAGASMANSAQPQRPEPMPGQRFMDQESVDTVLGRMQAKERSTMGRSLEDESILPLAYRSGYFEYSVDEDGLPVLKEVEVSSEDKTASIDTAAAASYRKYDLYISIYVGRTSYSPGYEYLVESYFDWRAGKNGMDAGNCGKDHMGVAWGNNQLSAGSRGTQSGMYWDWLLQETSSYPLNIEKTDQAPNVGASWEFNEWRPVALGCSGWLASEWGRASLYLRSTTYRNMSTDFVYKYFHTWSGTDYSISFSAVPQVNISPTSEQWSAPISVDIVT